MNATILPEKKKHYPVLLKEIISIITPQYGGTFIDCTYGQGGYTEKILEHPKTKVIALDRDSESIKTSANIQKKYGKRFLIQNKKFSQIKELNLSNENIKSIIFDLGYSYVQIKDSKKGLSFNNDCELNMKMGLNEFSAKDVIHKLSKNELAKIFKFFGNEKDSKKIASNIVNKRETRNIDTQGLVKIIQGSKKKKNYKLHFATKIFQSLRIFVNKEISELIYALIDAAKILRPGGKILVVTFNSLEDRIVKFFFKSLSEKRSVSRYVPKTVDEDNLFKLVNKKPIVPSEKELKENFHSRSAKLRFAIKDKDVLNFEKEILEKFNYLLEIENLSKKL